MTHMRPLLWKKISITWISPLLLVAKVTIVKMCLIMSVSGNESGHQNKLQEVYEKLCKECLKLTKLNKASLEKSELCKIEKDCLQDKLGEPMGIADQLQTRNVSLEEKVKTLGHELILSNTKLYNSLIEHKNLINS